MKIKQIEVKNFKAISEEVAEFNGCSAIITAGNNKGKTSILRGLIDRFRGEKPDLIVKDGEQKGFNIIELTDGAKIEWKFTDKTESFAYITKEGIKQTTGVLSMIGERYFGIKFDIDKFLNSGTQVQTKELQRIVGLDFIDIDNRYKIAYENRTDVNKELQRVVSLKKEEPVKLEKPNLKVLEDEKTKINNGNTKLKDDWKIKNKEQRDVAINFNQDQQSKVDRYSLIDDSYHLLIKHQGGLWTDCIDFNKAKKILESTPKADYDKDGKLITSEIKDIDEPKYNSLEEIESKIKTANENLINFNTYENNLKIYNDWVDEGKNARKNQEDADKKVKEIQKEKIDLIATADIPEDFKITENGILYKGLPLTDSQISSSAKYIAALKLGSMVLGEIRTMHFDASFLDKNSLTEIQGWANENDLQLLIERPDFDGGEIKYEII